MQQTARDHEHRESRHAADEVRRFDERQRHVQLQQIGRLARQRRHAGNQQPRAGDEGERRQQQRRDRDCRATDRSGDAGAQFVACEQHGGCDQRQQVVDDAIQKERADDLLGRRASTACKQDHRFEHAQAARHVTQQSERHGHRVPREECRQADDARGQQEPQSGGGRGQIERGDHQLPDREIRRRQPHRPAIEQTDLASPCGGDDQRADREEQEKRDRAQHPARYVHERSDVPSAPEQSRRTERGHADDERARVEGGSLRDASCLDAGSRVQPHSHGATGQHAETDRVTQCVGDERSEQHSAATNLGARVAQRREVVAGEHEIAEHGREPRPQQIRRGLRRDLLHDLGVAHLAQQAAQRVEDERAEQKHDGADRPWTPLVPSACTFGRQALLLQQRERF